MASLRRTPLSLSLLMLSACALACQTPPSNEDEGESNDDDVDVADTDASSDDGPTVICTPGETRCLDVDTLETCAPTGLKWDPSTCTNYEVCEACYDQDEFGGCLAACVGPCEKLKDTPSSEGCSFYTTGMNQGASQLDEPPPDAIVVGNPQDVPATVWLNFVPEGTNMEGLVTEYKGEPIENPIVLQPNESHVFLLPGELTVINQAASELRFGAVHHVVSDLPVIAYLHSPFLASSTNGASLLLPEHMLTGEYVVVGREVYQPTSYFVVIALENQTTITWRPPVETAGDALNLPFVEADQTGSMVLNRFDNIRIDTSEKLERPRCEQDLSGTLVSADKPIWLVSATVGVRVPYCATNPAEGCAPPAPVDSACQATSDFIQEQVIPLEYWGKEYVGGHSPVRGDERHYWRVFAGDDAVTVTVDPPQPGSPFVLANRGEWVEFDVDNGVNLHFTSTGPFMPVQYVAGGWTSDDMGSPAMVQMVPTAQFLDRYSFVTGEGYDDNYIQVTREAGNADVLIDGVAIGTDPFLGAWEPIDGYEVANVRLPGKDPMNPKAYAAYQIESEDYFGIVQFGYSAHVSTANPSAGYAYPGGMKSEVLFIP